MDLVKENKPVKYHAVLLRAHCREIYLRASQIPTVTRTQQRWLMATDKELFDLAEVKLDEVGNIKADPYEKPEESVEVELSKDAALVSLNLFTA